VRAGEVVETALRPGPHHQRPGVVRDQFDDCFSGLDAETDLAVRTALAPELADATVVIVAQRVGAVQDADLILVLEDGRVVGRGSHEHLLTENGTYREIVRSQLDNVEEAA
ncbi:hypothetical protein ACWCQ4_41820, partial [Streptomyces aureus]